MIPCQENFYCAIAKNHLNQFDKTMTDTKKNKLVKAKSDAIKRENADLLPTLMREGRPQQSPQVS